MDKTKLEWPILKKLMTEFGRKIHSQLINECDYTNKIGQHPEGVALYNSSKKLCFVLLPKNASTTMMYTTMFYPNAVEWKLCNFLKDSDLEIDKFIVILRDPVQRYISATNMFLTSSKPMLPTRIQKNKIYSDDCHFRAQHEFIQSVPKDKIDFFYFGDSVIEHIKNYYGLNFSIVPQHNKGTKLVTAVDETLIKTLYADDYELINSVNFVNMP
jgi:hypothetical protein